MTIPLLQLIACLCTAPRPSDYAAATVASVIDGDTVVLGDGTKVRLKGINAPETGECVADDATRALRELSRDGLRVEAFGHDRYGRLLAYLWTPSGILVQEQLVERGLALANAYGKPGPAATRLAAAQRVAETATRGLFDPAACGPPSTLGVRITAIDANPPGDDTAPGAGESVTLTGPAGADLSGWELLDKTASHRLDFPPGTRLDARGQLTVYTSCGPSAPGRLHACVRGSAVWNNDGDTAFLHDPNGSLVDHRDWPP